MRKIDIRDFRLGTRGTGGDINRQILLNLVREHQPISRADLARRMKVARGSVSFMVTQLLEEGLLSEGDVAEIPRGRRPKMLYVRTDNRRVVAVDVRARQTHMMLTDLSGEPIALESFPTILQPHLFIQDLAGRILATLDAQAGPVKCEGIGVVVPGMVGAGGKVVNAAQLGWRDVDIGDSLADATGLPVFIENGPASCALAQLWLGGDDTAARDFVYVNVAEGVGAGIVMHGQLVRGANYSAGELGHIPVEPNGHACVCGSKGCLEVYTSNLATVERYLEATSATTSYGSGGDDLTIGEVIARARRGDRPARKALEATGHYLGVGMSVVINTLNPPRIYVSGDILAAWNVVRSRMQQVIDERALSAAAAATPIIADREPNPRLRGATALIAAPFFAAPRIA